MTWPYDNHHCKPCGTTISNKKGKGYCETHQKSCSNGHPKWIMYKNEKCKKCKEKVQTAARNEKKDPENTNKEQEKKDKKRDKESEIYKPRKDDK
jgi:uncharacterized Zn finger protein (UPF0148 family)